MLPTKKESRRSKLALQEIFWYDIIKSKTKQRKKYVENYVVPKRRVSTRGNDISQSSHYIGRDGYLFQILGTPFSKKYNNRSKHGFIGVEVSNF